MDSTLERHMVSMTDATNGLAGVVDRVRRDHEPTYLTRQNKPVAVVVDADDFDKLVDLAEDALDAKLATEAVEKGDFLDFDTVARELGW